MSGGRGGGGKDKRADDALQAVVVACSFDQNLWPAADRDAAACLVPLANRPLLYYALDMLDAAGIADVVLFCGSGAADAIRAFVAGCGLPRLRVVYTTSDTCRSYGDVLRHLDACALIRGDFVLVPGTAVGRLPLLRLAERFKDLRQHRDRGAVMTMVCGRRRKRGGGGDGATLVLDADSGRVLFHDPRGGGGKIDLPAERLLLDGGSTTVRVRRDLCVTDVAVCSAAVPPLFADNFDFQTRDDFVRGLLLNEEILNSTLYAHVVDDDDDNDYVDAVTDWPSYQRVTRDVMRRWTYPQVPDVVDRYGLRFGNVYVGEGLELALTCRVGADTMLGHGARCGAGARIANSVIGAGCRIGAGAVVEGSYLFDGVTVADNSTVRFSVLGRGCVVGPGSLVANGCVLAAGVEIGAAAELRQKRVVRSPSAAAGLRTVRLGDRAYVCDDGKPNRDGSDDSDSDDDDAASPRRQTAGLRYRTESTASHSPCGSSADEDDSDDDDTASVAAASVPDDTCMFYTEVVDSLVRGFEDHVHCDNLILEINSSRYAYNINYREANFQVIRAMLTMDNAQDEQQPPDQVRFYTRLRSKLDYFLPVLRNYIKNIDSCEDCLSAIEDVARTGGPLNAAVVVKVIHHLYDVDVLSEESILKWHRKEEHEHEDGVDNDDVVRFAKLIRQKADKLVEWLKDAEEETDSDEEDSS